MKRMLLAIAVLGASAMDAEIDVPLDRSQWETLKALGAPDPSAGERMVRRSRRWWWQSLPKSVRAARS